MSSRRFAFALTVFLFINLASCFADQIILANGDRLTGVIKKFDDQKIYIKTDYSDEVAIKWSAVAKVVGDQPLRVESSNGTKFDAPTINASGNNVTIEATPSPVTVAPADIKTIRSASEELAYENSLHPGWWHAWQGGGNLGIALARGNSDTTNVSLGFAVDRKTVNDKTSIYANSIYSTDGNLSTTTANDLRGGIRYDRDFSKHTFGYVSGDLEHDSLQNLDIRAILGAGVGYHAINTKTTSLDFLGGLAYTRENYNPGTDNNFISLSLGEQYTHKLNASTTFTQDAFVLPYLNSLGDFRATFDFGLATKISKLLTWQVNFSDRYVTNPEGLNKKNDLLLTTGLGVTFGKKE